MGGMCLLIGTLVGIIVLLGVGIVYLVFKLGYLKRENAELSTTVRQCESVRLEKEKAEKENVRLQEQLKNTQEKLEWLEKAKEELEKAFKAVASDVTSKNTEAFFIQASDKLGGVVEPLKENLQSLRNYLQEIEQKREGAYGSLQALANEILKTHSELQREVVGLKSALKSSTPRGRWGEYELRRIVEMAGMTKYVSFLEQETAGERRPDMVIKLPKGGSIPIDAKVPLEAYFEAMETDDPRAQQEKLAKHVRSMKETIRGLSRKKYWNSFERTPEFVIMFVPVEAAVRIAFEMEPNLLDDAFNQKVLITTPVTLLALLKAVAFGWQQFQWAENARMIAQEGTELYKRAVKFLEHYNDVGKKLDSLVEAYNKSVGSLQSRFFPSLKRMTELSGELEEPPSVSEIDVRPRSLEILDDK